MRKTLLILLLCLVFAPAVGAQPHEAYPLLPLSGDIVSDDAPATPDLGESLFGGGRIYVHLSVVCLNDFSLEASMWQIARDKLLELDGVQLCDSLERASVILSFVVRRATEGDGLPSSAIAYSFAYGMPELSFEGAELVSLPRYITHQPVLTTRDDLDARIEANVRAVDADFIAILRAHERRPFDR